MRSQIGGPFRFKRNILKINNYKTTFEQSCVKIKCNIVATIINSYFSLLI